MHPRDDPSRPSVKLLAITAGLALLLAACGASSSEASRTTIPRDAGTTATPATSATTTKPDRSTTTTTAVTEPVLDAPFYEDGFTDDTKGWPSGDAAGATYTLSTGDVPQRFNIKLTEPGAVSPHPEFRDITPEQLHDYAVTAVLQTTLQISQRDDLGVTCRDLKGQRYKFVMNMPIDQDEPNTWAIVKVTPDGSKQLAKGTAAIGGTAFEVTGSCRGGTDGPAQLDMAINHKWVGSATDDDQPLTEGYGGVHLNSSGGGSSLNILHFQASKAS